MKRKTGCPDRAVLKNVLLHIICLIVGFMLSTVRFAAGTMPFGLAFAGGGPAGAAVISAAGAAGGYLFACNTMDALKNVGAAALICFIRLGIGKTLTDRKRKYLITVSVIFSSAVSALIVRASEGLDAASVSLSLCEAVTAGAGCWFFTCLSDTLSGRGRTGSSGTGDSAAAILSVGAVLLAADSLTGGRVSVSHAAGAFLIMLLSLCGRNVTALLCGTALGLLAGSSEDGGRLLFALPAAALLCTASGSCGKAACAAALTVSDLLSLLLRGGGENAIVFLCETFLCSAVFLLLPRSVLEEAGRRLLPFCCEEPGREGNRALAFRLSAASRALTSVGESVRAVTDVLRKTDFPTPDGIPDGVREEVCRDCAKRELCRLRCGAAGEAFTEANAILMEKGRLDPADLPERLGEVCTARERLCGAFNRAYCEYQAALFARGDVFESKELAAMQFLNTGAILAEAAADAERGGRDDPMIAAAADSVLAEFGFEAEPVIAVADPQGKSTLSVFCSSVPGNADYEGLADRLCERTGRYYLPPSRDSFGRGGTALSFCEAERYEAVVSVAVRKDPTEKYCGDSCATFYDGRGNFYVVLSDGMGRGSRAALDSLMTASLTEKLLKAGFSTDCALSAVNAALMVKSDNETLATLDVLRLGLSTGKAEFFKAGAALSVVRTGGKTAVIEPSSLPLGILREAGFETASLKLSPGDRILMMTDGAAVLPHPYFRDLLTKMKNAACSETAEAAADSAVRASPSGKTDDITVVCVEII